MQDGSRRFVRADHPGIRPSRKQRRQKRLVFATVVAAISATVVVGGLLAQSLLLSDAATTAQTETRTLAAVNVVRLNRGLHKLTLSVPLRTAARAHSRDMLRLDYFGHTKPFTATLRKYTKASVIAENVAWGTSDYGKAAGIVSLWMASPGHRKVLLTASLRKIGCGIVRGRFMGQGGATVATCDFSS